MTTQHQMHRANAESVHNARANRRIAVPAATNASASTEMQPSKKSLHAVTDCARRGVACAQSSLVIWTVRFRAAMTGENLAMIWASTVCSAASRRTRTDSEPATCTVRDTERFLSLTHSPLTHSLISHTDTILHISLFKRQKIHARLSHHVVGHNPKALLAVLQHPVDRRHLSQALLKTAQEVNRRRLQKNKSVGHGHGRAGGKQTAARDSGRHGIKKTKVVI